jgi:multicomponent Na+:H+ antiporter subunit B
VWVELLLLVLVVLVAFVIARLGDLFAAAMLTGIFSLLCAGLYTIMDAVDVAFTEAAVGAGITTVLFLGALGMTSTDERQQRFRWRPLLVVVLTGGALMWGTSDMPAFGDPAAPIHHHVEPEYLEGAASDIHIANVVTAVLASYRGYDTLGEVAVVFTAAVGVMLLLGRAAGGAARHWRRGADRSLGVGGEGATEAAERRDAPMLMREKPVLRVSVRLVIPFILLFALYVQAHGDFGPGGGFQAGVIFAAGLILFGLIFDPQAVARVFPPAVAEALIAIGVLLYGGTGVATLLLGGKFLDYDELGPSNGQHYGILAVELGVGIAVAAAMVRLYFAFSALHPEDVVEPQ